MGVTKAAIKELEDATSALWGQCGTFASIGRPRRGSSGSRLLILPGRKRKRRRLGGRLTNWKRRYGIEKKGYAISVSDLDGG